MGKTKAPHPGLARHGVVNRSRPLLTCLLLFVAVCSALARAGAAAVSTLPTLQQQPDQSWLVEAAGYRAVIGPDGNLHSFRVGDDEMLDDRIAISLGAFFYAEGPRKLDQISQLGPTTLEATDGTHTAQYHFLRRDIDLYLATRGRAPVPYFVVLSPQITIVSRLGGAEAAAAPCTETWGDVRASTAKGAFIELTGGARIWGPWLGRQVWEVSSVEPGRKIQLRISGGLADPPKPTLEQLIGARVKVDSPNAIVHVDNPLVLQVAIENRSDNALSGLLSMELAACRTDQVLYATAPLQLPPKQATQTSFRASVHAPDFYRARITFSAEGRDLAAARAAAGYRVAEIRSVVPRPDDFREFWQRLLAEVGDQAPEFRLDLAEDRSRDGVSVWVARCAGIADKTISGWYVCPDAAGPLPAILYLSGYGARPIPPPIGLAQRGYAVLAIDVRGNAVDRPRAHPFEDYCTLGIEAPETYVYREIIGHALRALHFLASRQEVDPGRIAVVGVSEGGGLGLILGALSPQVKAVAADAPMLCDFPLSLRAAAWPYTQISRFLQGDPPRAAAVRRTLSYFDVAAFAPDITCPVLLSTGFLDPVSLPAAVYGAFNLIAGPKEAVPFPEAGHEGGGDQFWAYKLDWLANTLRPQPAS